MRKVNCYDVEKIALELAGMIAKGVSKPGNAYPKILLVPVPRGGVPVAWAISAGLAKLQFSARVADFPALVDEFAIVVDDILVTGASLTKVVGGRPHVHGAAVLMAKGSSWNTGLPSPSTLYVGENVDSDVWVQFPWEVNDEDEGKPEDAVIRLIEYLGDDPNREGVKDTPRRVLHFLDEMRAARKDETNLTTFKSQVNDLVVIRDIPLFSLCEHHMLPYFGKAHIGYLPGGKVLGLSKVARIASKRAAGLTMQEELSAAIADDVKQASESEDVAVVTQAVHTCMVMRGVRAVGSETIASAMTGSFRTDQMLRSEFMSFIGAGRA